ncbi:hypothetical protein GIB67_013577 [Kingdonia uniflora]|uniref:RNase H type-1 domain-containing protein n=1 Tax=Kingdonia uniflora TaxID=39325 RepID=A0A7J7KV01_9MAGN|nr:hypothetical protein GIB67_013577 [Kingdonia uniflora]
MDPCKKKDIIVSWEKCCRPMQEGGLGLTRFSDINITMLMKLAWNFITEGSLWANYMRAKFLTRAGDATAYYKQSSIWPGIKNILPDLIKESFWIIEKQKLIHEAQAVNNRISKVQILRPIHNPDKFSKGTMNNSVEDLSIFHQLGVPLKFKRPHRIRSCRCELPRFEEIKINCDGASLGNPGISGTGSVFRDHTGVVLGVYMKNIGVAYYLAECSSIISSLKNAMQRGWLQVFFVSGSKSAIDSFKSNKVPGKLQSEWTHLRSQLAIRFKHSWRECNFNADSCSIKAAAMPINTDSWIDGRTTFLYSIENQFQNYYRFD